MGIRKNLRTIGAERSSASLSIVTVSVTARHATRDDVPDLVRFYGELEQEMDALHVMWKRADALPHPVDEAFAASIESPDAVVVIGELDGLPFGFLIATVEALVDGSVIGAIRFIFTEQAAREVGVAASMLALALAELRSRGVSRFDAHVLPGHRLVKNFFEAGGFSARTIVMHHDDNA